MATVRELLQAGTDLPGDSARLDTEILLCHCLGKSRTWLYTWPEKAVLPDSMQRFEALLAQRRSGVPVAYLTGEREFWSLPLSVNSATLIPRPETETLIAWALTLPLPAAASVLDLGTGSGAIALAVASEQPSWQVTAVDSSESALQLARSNAAKTGLEHVVFVRSDWYAALGAQRFHLLLANPPYIDSDDPHLAQGDVRFEPASALTSGADGLDDIKHIIALAPAHLLEGGLLAFEHGFDQAKAVGDLLHAQGFVNVSTAQDYGGNDRVTYGYLSTTR